ncbi:uncharacterized protein LOC135827486 [Sycon ciliatum]|uniref:uncharacterized protein LOC135827486 n=1 Tax=Sycon ciliatum TaxID=27933 RepID=UPI0031F62A67
MSTAMLANLLTLSLVSVFSVATSTVGSGGWSQWGAWSSCSASCGVGYSSRTRVCNHQVQSSCTGRAIDYKGCENQPCAVESGGQCPGGWLQGALKCYKRMDQKARNFSEAHFACAGLSGASRMLSIVSADAQHDFVAVVLRAGTWPWISLSDSHTEDVWLNRHSEVVYSNWNTQTGEPNGGQDQNCALAPFQYGGMWIDEPCKKLYHTICEMDFIVDTKWSDWSGWTVCNGSCLQARTRHCMKSVSPTDAGLCDGDSLEHRPCTTCNVSVDSKWSDWSEWSACDSFCSQNRTRHCINPASTTTDGGRCTGPSLEQRTCVNRTCHDFCPEFASHLSTRHIKIVGLERYGVVTPFTGNTTSGAGLVNASLVFECADRFKFLESQNSTLTATTCSVNSNWNGRVPFCIPVCQRAKCPHASQRCITDPGNTHRYKCVCHNSETCTDAYEPVCATDAQDYDNRCHMAMEACQTNTTLTVAKDGFCERAGKCSEEKPRPPPTRTCNPTGYRYYYDNTSRSCQRMNVGRCYTAGGDNSFHLQSQCADACEQGDACDQSLDPGPCKQMTERFYYDSTENTCKSFQYGGCFGTENNFASKQSCENTCRGVRCPVPASIVNGAVSVANRRVGSTATFTCDEDYGLRGEAQTQCQQTGNWSNAVPTCVAQCPPARCNSEDRDVCSHNFIRPIDACAPEALKNTDIAIIAKLRPDTENCSSDQQLTFTMLVRKELHRSARCSFLPNTERYDVLVQVRRGDAGCPCPLTMPDRIYMITAVCDVQQQRLTLHDKSIFKVRNDKALGNLKLRCGFA